MGLKLLIVLTLVGSSAAILKQWSYDVKAASNDVQKGIIDGQKLLPKFRASYSGKPTQEAAAGKATLAAGTSQVTEGIRSLHKLEEELQSSLAEVRATEKAELAGIEELAKKTENPELMKVKQHAEMTLDTLPPKKQEAKLLVKTGSQEAVVGQYESVDALAQQKVDEANRMAEASKVDKTSWVSVANAAYLEAWDAVFPSAPISFAMKPKSTEDPAQKNATKAFYASRNAATRMFFRGVSRFPTTELKMSALENFLQQVEVETKKPVGGRLYKHEVDHWLTNEFLSEDIAENMEGIGFIMGGALPSTLASRDDNFKTEFHKRFGCAKETLISMSKKHMDHPMLMRYGSKCGLDDDLEATTSCKKNTKSDVVGNETLNICADNGLDRCCAQHDLSKTEQRLSKIEMMEPCKADRNLVSCANKVQSGSNFVDVNGVSEDEGKKSVECLYNALPCLAKTSLWRVDVDFSRADKPVQLVKPHSSSKHHMIAFPWEDVKDMTPDSQVYRSHRDDKMNTPMLYHIKSK